jgi:predicted metal-dependent phosphoesterase TrpH
VTVIIIDIHIHTAEFSFDSVLPIEAALDRAVGIGLDGVCITDHESLGIAGRVEALTRQWGILVLPGIEILTDEGDFLVFGLDFVPDGRMPARKLLSLLSAGGGVAVAAHPYRDNGRGTGDFLYELREPTGIEVFNGRTMACHNESAMEAAKMTGLARLGGSDAHSVSEIGRFATRISHRVRNLDDFLSALRRKEVCPVFFDGSCFHDVPDGLNGKPAMPGVPILLGEAGVGS